MLRLLLVRLLMLLVRLLMLLVLLLMLLVGVWVGVLLRGLHYCLRVDRELLLELLGRRWIVAVPPFASVRVRHDTIPLSHNDTTTHSRH